MPKLQNKKILAPEKQFLAIPDHYVNLVGYVKYTNLESLAKMDSDFGEKTIKRGTLVHLADTGEVSVPTEDNAPNAVIFNTVKIGDFDASDTQVNLTVLVHGFVRKDRLIEVEETHGIVANLANAMIYVMNN